MHPLVRIGTISFFVFPIIIMFAIFFCIYCFLRNSAKYEFFGITQTLLVMRHCLLFALVGGKFLYAIACKAQSLTEFLKELIFGGFVFYGGVMGAVIGLLFYCRKRHQYLLNYTDVLFTLLPGGQAIGRIGCYLNGCCYGRAYEGVFSVRYIVDGVVKMVFPTWFFEAAFCSILFCVFQILIKTDRRGLQTGIYLCAYSFFRFWLEFMRGDEIRGRFGLLSTSQWISLAVCGVGVWTIIVSVRTYRRNFLLKRRIEPRWK